MPDADEPIGGAIPEPIEAAAEPGIDPEETERPDGEPLAAGRPETSDPEPSFELDAVLAASEDRARAALAEITPVETIGEFVGALAQGQHVASLQFANRMRGYPGWLWTATLSRIDESEDVTVLEVELLPGEGSVLAPDWVPWSVRLADYRAAQDDGDEDDDAIDEDDDDAVDEDAVDELGDEPDDEDEPEDEPEDEFEDDSGDEGSDEDESDELDDPEDDESDDEPARTAPPRRARRRRR
ncbi:MULTISPECIES: DUF3027 domain-containing protein [unclassified Rathayibacter]|uniref:DUF3027 domain-containing protein n=1 Tax=unclassified Rathayibacter TaxID=2609250 RepID=UPI00188C0B0C|nr:MULTISPECIES: DUF3027 domain-containing protein [unclassified Rathayibacter]MBF4461737.1 DUF3027 domain-containing protein [Rathayibacter sp. VKM Ac-2879]MBF4503148.1 DUF3027 domain-containing protein [Rathayibacter sp. VKM Ac-2878]